MLRFFRQLRQRLLTENKFSKYLLYAIGEILLVVIGILIALQLDQNAEKKQQDKTRHEYYIQLLEDLKKDRKFTVETIARFEADEKAYNEYLELYAGPPLAPQKVYEHLMTLNIYSTAFSFNSNTIESLRSSGEIILIPLDIRNRLINLLRLQDNILKEVQYNDTGKNNMIQELGIYRGASTLENRLQGQPELRKYLKFDENLPKIILGLESAIRWKNYSETSSKNILQLMLDEIEVIIQMLEQEIEKFNP